MSDVGLFGYLRQVQRLMRDGNQELLNPADLMDFINRARRQVALQSQSIRFVPPVCGQVQTVTITNPGSGYTNPTVVLTAPDFPSGAQLFPQGAQATAVATLDANGGIASVNVVFGGDGYFQPQVSITDPTGTGFTGTVQTSPINVTVQGQEIYPFSQVPLGTIPGVDGIYNVRNVSIIFNNWRYSCLFYDFSTYQASIRRYPQDYQYIPSVFSQVGQGKSGTLYEYALPNAAYQQEWSCVGSPADLISDQSVEAIPEPWTDSVPFLAAYYCMLSLSNLNAARFYKEEFDNFVSRYSAGSRPGRTINYYGRY
jgi:hypothetical protein